MAIVVKGPAGCGRTAGLCTRHRNPSDGPNDLLGGFDRNNGPFQLFKHNSYQLSPFELYITFHTCIAFITNWWKHKVDATVNDRHVKLYRPERQTSQRTCERHINTTPFSEIFVSAFWPSSFYQSHACKFHDFSGGKQEAYHVMYCSMSDVRYKRVYRVHRSTVCSWRVVRKVFLAFITLKWKRTLVKN